MPTCAKCNSANVRRSRHNLLDRFRSLFGQTPFRCRACRHRFHTTEAAPIKGQHRKESHRRRRATLKREFFVYAAAMCAVAVVFFVITLPEV
ncbi:MAG TPA: hypothetical protein VER03_08170 [Bryobacteraceae bacterium]|nr:hypothetical protein [Bryobacteraceae bacterium]